MTTKCANRTRTRQDMGPGEDPVVKIRWDPPFDEGPHAVEFAFSLADMSGSDLLYNPGCTPVQGPEESGANDREL
jgi:hypothetical protein